MPMEQIEGYQGLNVFYGDIHNHCGMSYGHGTLAEALNNAHLQLDFVSVTLHAVWPDIPEKDPRLGYLVDYHKEGFRKAFKNWVEYNRRINGENRPGDFITFPSYEWHSNQYGDHCVYYLSGKGQPILEVDDLPEFRRRLKQLSTDALLIPHHIGYKRNYRGLNWNAFTEELSPVVEIFSFHGASENCEGPYPYLHTMGPRHGSSCAQAGWSQGHIFGVVGSTDHHNAFPGSYGYGRMGVWAEKLTREDIWESIKERRTYALTGDRIELAFSMNGLPMGSICPSDKNRNLHVAVTGGSRIDYVDVLHNNRVIHRECPIHQQTSDNQYKVYLELGWGEKPEDTQWEVDLRLINGEFVGIEPRFRGFGSQGNPDQNNYAYTKWEQPGSGRIYFSTRTRPNPSLHTASTEGMCFEIKADQKTKLVAEINGHKYEHELATLIDGAKTHYLGGFVSPAVCFHRAIPQSEYQHNFSFQHSHQPEGRDWYYLRVRQSNNQWAWSSPIWIDD